MNKIMKYTVEGKAPSYANENAAGLDLCYNGNEDITIMLGQIVDLETKLKVAIPKGYVGLVVTRSGIGRKGLTILNSVGIIDEDYRGEIGLRVKNTGDKAININKGDRVAQMVLVPYIQAYLELVDELDETERGENGFGSTGV